MFLDRFQIFRFDFWCAGDRLETGLEFDAFSWLWRYAQPRSKARDQLAVNCWVPMPYSNSPNAPSSFQETQCNLKHAGINRYGTIRAQNERSTGRQDAGLRNSLGSLVALPKRGEQRTLQWDYDQKEDERHNEAASRYTGPKHFCVFLVVRQIASRALMPQPLVH